MELFQLRYFLAVASALNYTKAAKELHVSQSALSRQIIELEQELGVRLFDRNRQRVRLTDEGRVVCTHAEKVLCEVAALAAAAKDLAEGCGGELVVTYNWRVFFNFIPDTIAEFRRLHPESEVRLKEVVLRDQTAALHAGKVHLAFLPGELLADDPAFARLRVLASDLVAIVSRRHRLADRRRIALRELAEDTWLLNDGLAKVYPAFIRQYCRAAGFAPLFGRSGSNIEELLSLVAAGYGVVLLPRYIAAKHHGIASVRMLATDCAPIELCAVWMRENHSRLLLDYLAVLREHLRAEGG